MNLTFAIPRGCVPLPTAGDGSDLYSATDIASLGHSGSTQSDVTAAIEATGSYFRSQDIAFAGVLTVPEDPRGSALVTIAVRTLRGKAHDLDTDDLRSSAARAIADDLSRRVRHAFVQYRDLSCGPTVLIARSGEFRIPSEQSVDGVEHAIPAESLQAILPLPSGDSIAVIDISSSETEHWHGYVSAALSLVDSIRTGASDVEESELK